MPALLLPDRASRASLLRLAILALVLAATLASWGAARAQADDAPSTLLVPEARVRVGDGAVTFQAFGSEVSYLSGLGWTTGWSVPAPAVGADGRVRIAPATAQALRLPHLAALRTGLDGATTRLVLDLGAVDAGGLEGVRQEETLSPGRPFEIELPGVLVPDGALLAQDGLEVTSVPADARRPARLVVRGPDADVRAFPLAAPTRVVIDLTPAAPGRVRAAADAPATLDGAAAAGGRSTAAADRSRPPERPEDEEREVAPGVLYRRITAPGADGPSAVHVVELDPDAVELRVVGRSGEGRTVAEWADGGVAAINAGYFDPDTFEAIGLRRIGGALTSWPSRGRAAVGFGATGTVVARAGADVQVRVDGRLAVDARIEADGPLSWSSVEGARVGSARTGVIVLDVADRAVRNGVGPARVPAGGAALAYDPGLRPLALVEPGQRVDVAARLVPRDLERASWAVEAGPLLLQDGHAAFAPELEGFARGERILDEPTQQSALGVRADGTVLLVVAERMVAQDLVPLFERLGARAALRLDSGSSATLVADGRTVNRLLSRRVESAIVAVPALEARRAR
jgi:hypothetical protein